MKKIQIIKAADDGSRVPLYKINLEGGGVMKVLFNIATLDDPRFSGVQITLLSWVLLIGTQKDPQPTASQSQEGA